MREPGLSSVPRQLPASRTTARLMSPLNRSQFKFRRHDTIGAEGAEQDVEYLRECFVDTGDLAVLRNTKDPRRIVVGRTGAGKSALLLLLAKTEQRVASIEPEQLALSYIANSTILRYLDGLGVNLDLFYRLLWRHIFAIELIQLKYGLRSADDQKGFFLKIRELFKGDRRKDEAVAYLTQWGDKFWKDTEFRVHEVTEKFEEDIRAKLGARMADIEAGIDTGKTLSTEDRREIVHRAQAVVDSVQIQQLSKVIDILAADVFDDPQQKFFVLIDRLDEHWVADALRYKLIRALIETVKDLQRITTAKIVVAIRRDLLRRVFRETRDAGFQEEKYQALYLPISWSRDTLLSVLDVRLARLIRHQYSAAAVSWQDVFPRRVGQSDTGDYLVERTLYRPRDVIQFCNCCIELSVNRPDITAQTVREAESTYSTLRFRSLGDEWAADYPELLQIAELLRKRPPLFPASDITVEQLDGHCIQELDGMPPSRLQDYFSSYYNNAISLDDLRARVLVTLYEVGLIGLKPHDNQPISWSFRERDVLRSADIGPETRVAITPMFYRVLGTVTRGSESLSH